MTGPLEGPGWAGVSVEELMAWRDVRGSLTELFRSDGYPENMPAMAYTSVTSAGKSRGPHEHKQQTDTFVFIGVGSFHLKLWDNRHCSVTYNAKWDILLPAGTPIRVVVPPGVVHGYHNTGETDGIVINLPDMLYRGHGREYDVDEIRHEAGAEPSKFRM